MDQMGHDVEVPTGESWYGDYIQRSTPKEPARVNGVIYQLPKDTTFQYILATCVQDIVEGPVNRIPAIVNHLMERHEENVMAVYRPFQDQNSPLLAITGVVAWETAEPPVSRAEHDAKRRAGISSWNPKAPNKPLAWSATLSKFWKVHQYVHKEGALADLVTTEENYNAMLEFVIA